MISNTSPLILLSKLGKLAILKDLFNNITISKEVQEEVITPNRADAQTIQEAINQNWIKVKESKTKKDLGLGKGENSVILLAHEKKDTLIIDDAAGVKMARSLGIPILRTTSVFFLALKKNLINKEQTIKLLNKLIEEGYYIAPKHYTRLLDKLREK
ncbi:hypothetical protein CMI48_01580 [Candidatus Pacearchaeota archaeon]|nr:hypothetical protein [Candidatus Pacearchaeota archaeon]